MRFVAFLSLAFFLPALGAADFDAVTQAGFRRVMRDFWWPGTSLIYTCPPAEVQKADFYTDGFKIWEKPGDYGHGLEDCAIIGGVALSGLCDAFEVTGNAALRETARQVAQGLVNLGTVHGVKGFIARGICVEDGRSVCALSSIDQHTHAIHGLWRYYFSPICDDRLRSEIRRVLSEVADRMTAQVTKENGWSFQQAVGHGSTGGICKMRFNRPHEGMRLAMFYAAAWAVSGDGRYRAKFREYLDEDVAKSMELAMATPEQMKGLLRYMPDYTLLQMQTSLELVLATVGSDADRERVRACMQKPAQMAAERALRLKGRDTKYLCGCGETALAQLMTPGFPFGADQLRTLMDAIRAQPLDSVASSCRTVHLYAAWWRLRRRGLNVGFNGNETVK